MALDRRQWLGGALLGAVAGVQQAWAQAGSAPALRGTGRVFAGFPPGGTLDITARRFAESARPHFSDGLIVENRVGAGGRLAIEAVKSAEPDGLAMLVSPDSVFTIYPYFYRRLAYDPAVDVAPVSSICTITFAFAVGPRVPEAVRTLAQFVDWAKANPDLAAYGHPATGSMPHFLGNEFSRVAGLKLQPVPYRGSVPALQDLIGGHATSVLTVLGDFLPHLSTGKLRMLAVTSRSRSRFLPEVPTFEEQGFRGVVGVETYGLFLPGRASAALAERAAGWVKDAAADPAVVKVLASIAAEPAPVAPAEYRAYLAKERDTWGPVVKASGFSSDD